MLTLYFAPGFSSMGAHIALYEIGVPFEGRPMSFKNQDMRAREFLALNPEGKVPVLLIDGRPLTEVTAILYYLAKHFPDAELLPRNDPEAEAQALSWMSFSASSLHRARQHGLEYAKEVYVLPIAGWAAAGCWDAIRSPTSICSGCTGGWPIRFTLRRKRSPTSPRTISV
jgi:glutathione S-transferase